MIAIAVRREGLVHETLDLSNDRERFVDEGRQPPLRENRLLPIPQHPLGSRTEDAGMVRQCGANVAEEIGALRQEVIAVAIVEPVPRRSRTVHHLLKTENVGRCCRQIRDEPIVKLPAPAVEAHDAQGAALPSRCSAEAGVTSTCPGRDPP